MNYIQRRDSQSKQHETVDEFATHKEAVAMLTEYRLSDNSAYYYISQRACKDWNQ